MKYVLRILAVTATPVVAQPQSLETLNLAAQLANIIASEELCGFSYDQAAIRDWIDEKVDPSDMSFSSTLTTMTQGAAFQLQDLTESGKTAHCRSVERSARHVGFID